MQQPIGLAAVYVKKFDNCYFINLQNIFENKWKIVKCLEVNGGHFQSIL
jgi:hypothetical protein